MRFQPITVTVIAALSATSYAQDASQIAKFDSDIAALASSLVAHPAALASVAANVGASGVGQLEAFATNLGHLVTDTPAKVSAAIASLPTGAQAFATSVVDEALSIYSKDIGTATSSLSQLESSAAVLVSGITASASVSLPTSGTATGSAAKSSATGNDATRDIIERGLLAGSLMGAMGFMVAL